jgi:hypothetical protein
VPPLVAGLGPFSHVPWIKNLIPEVIWIGLLHQSLGEAAGAAAAVEIARTSEKHASHPSVPLFAGISDYRLLQDAERAKVLSDLETGGRMSGIRCALRPLVQFYPTCPLKFLYPEPPTGNVDSGLRTLKLVLHELFNKELRRSVMVQATVVYIAFALDRLKVRAGLTLSHFPEIENYPSTELSRRVASAARCTMFALFGKSVETATWPFEFWNRGGQIEPCTFGKEAPGE